MNEVFLSIIIPTLNRRRYIIGCLEELYRQAATFSDIEIIVIDNGSSDDTAEFVKSLIKTVGSKCKYVYEARRGSNISRNRGRQEASGKVIAIIDDDAIPHDQWLVRLRQHFLNRKSDCVAGRVELKLEIPLPDWFPRDLEWILGKTNYGDQSRAMKRGEFPQSNNCAFLAEVFDDLGGFNNESLIYGDETEFFKRAQIKNYSFVYRHDIAVDHCIPPERLSKTGLYKKGYLWGKGDAMYWMLFSPNLLRRVTRIMEYAIRTGYVGLISVLSPNFGRTYTFNFNYGHLRQLIRKLYSAQSYND